MILKKIYILTFIIYLFVSSSTTFADSKLEPSPTISNSSLDKINNLLDSCWVYRTKNPTLSLEFGQNALTLIDENKLIELKPKTLNYLGVVHRKLGNLEQSYNYYI
ncbi:MAG: hypothetical protein PF445_00675, partial [Melioribacteraceae bacterium]|nr:hypothetical protein [Melioribacteraceae bacterium]